MSHVFDCHIFPMGLFEYLVMSESIIWSKLSFKNWTLKINFVNSLFAIASIWNTRTGYQINDAKRYLISYLTMIYSCFTIPSTWTEMWYIWFWHIFYSFVRFDRTDIFNVNFLYFLWLSQTKCDVHVWNKYKN